MSGLYAAVGRLRRRWYARHPERRRRLPCPVISVGNLVVGGSGKTPVAACLARLLRQLGEQPAVLSRGYGRRRPHAGVLVVSTRDEVLADVETSGDEPLMLARELPGVPVLVSPDRHAAGRTAIEAFGATVLLLDDGYQHLRLARDVDLLIVSPDDLGERVLPAGRLREPLDAAAGADALLVAGDTADASRASRALGVPERFLLVRHYAALRPLAGAVPAAGRRVVAVAGIARPQRFFTAVAGQGWTVVRELAYGDHHWFTARDRRRIESEARALHADAIVTTMKDAVRLEAHMEGAGAAGATPWVVLPMEVAVEPADGFRSWLTGRIAAARRR